MYNDSNSKGHINNNETKSRTMLHKLPKKNDYRSKYYDKFWNHSRKMLLLWLYDISRLPILDSGIGFIGEKNQWHFYAGQQQHFLFTKI